MINFAAEPNFGRNTPAPTPAKVQARFASASTDLLDDPAEWTWQQLRDYVLRAISDRHGPQPTGNEIKTQSILQSFHKRWGPQAGPIARFAFEQQDGYWRSAPVTLTRFTKGNDEYFARPIAERLAA